MPIEESLDTLERLLKYEQTNENWKSYAELKPKDKLKLLKETRGDVVKPHEYKIEQLGGPLDRMAQMKRHVDFTYSLHLKVWGLRWLIFTGGCLILSFICKDINAL